MFPVTGHFQRPCLLCPLAPKVEPLDRPLDG